MVMNTASGQAGYIRYAVAGDGDCGYTAFGITREEAYTQLSQRIVTVRDIVSLVVHEALLTEPFYHYLQQRGIIGASISHDTVVQQGERYKTDLAIQQAYIDYDVRDRYVDAGWAHPRILQALAHINHIELHMWRLGESDVLIPHRIDREDYAVYIPPNVQSRADLLFINSNHFERVEFVGYPAGIPAESIYPCRGYFPSDKEISREKHLTDVEKTRWESSDSTITAQSHEQFSERVNNSNNDKTLSNFLIDAIVKAISSAVARSKSMQQDIDGVGYTGTLTCTITPDLPNSAGQITAESVSSTDNSVILNNPQSLERVLDKTLSDSPHKTKRIESEEQSSNPTQTLLDYHVDRYNASQLSLPEQVEQTSRILLILKAVFNQYQQLPTKDFWEINSILPLARLKIDKPEAAGLIRQLFENLRQNAASSTIESRPYFYGLLRAFQLADNRLFDADYFKKSIKYTVSELHRLKDLTPQSVALILLLLEQWNMCSEGKARLEPELSKDLIKLLDSQLSKLVKKDTTIGDDASFPFLIYHTLNLVKLMTKPVGNIAYRVYYRYLHPTVGLGNALGEQQLKIIPIVAGFTYLAATASILATPPGWVIGGAILTGVVGYMGLYKGLKGWWNSTKKDWDTYKTLEPDEASYRFCKDVLEALEILKDPEEADKWSDVFTTLKEHLPQKHYWGLHALLANFIGMTFIHHHGNSFTSPVKLLQDKTKPWIELCVSLCHHKYPYSLAWLNALALLSYNFPSLEPVIWEQLKLEKASFDGNILLEYRGKQKKVRDELSKKKDMQPEYVSDITLVNQKQEDWLQTTGALTFKSLREYWQRSPSTANALSWEQLRRDYITPRARLADTEVRLDDYYNQLITLAKTAKKGESHTHLLFGEAGMGKSSALQWLYEQLQEAYLKNLYDSQQPIPILISLAELKQSEKDFIIQWFCNLGRIEKEKYTDINLIELQKNYRFIFLLDGFDELVFCQGAFKAYQIVKDAQLDKWQCCVLISCRTHLEHQCQKFQAKQSYYLQGFDDTQKRDYLAQKVRNNSEQQTLLSSMNLPKTSVWPLLDNPLLLYMVSDSLESLQQLFAQQQAITRYKIYEMFTEKWFVREFERLASSGSLPNLFGKAEQRWQEGLVHYAEQIAVLMSKKQLIVVDGSLLDQKETYFLREVLLAENPDRHVLQLRSACPLKVIGLSSYQFIHKSFQEFLVAQALLRELPLTLKYIPESTEAEESRLNPFRKRCKDEGILYNELELFKGGVAVDINEFHDKLIQLKNNLWNQLELRKEPTVLEFLKEVNPNQYRLLQIMCASKGEAQPHYAVDNKTLCDMVYAGNPEVAKAAGNALTLFTYCGYSADGLNLSKTYYENANLQGGLFRETNFYDSQFTDVEASQSCWVGANLVRADIRGLQWGEWPSLILPKGCGSAVVALAYRTPTELIAAYRNGLLVEWSLLSYKIIRCYANTKLITRLVYDASGSKPILISGHDDGSLASWDVTSGTCIQSWQAHKQEITSLAYCASRRQIASGSSYDNILRLWDLATGKCHMLQSHERDVRCLAYSPSGAFLASGDSHGKLYLWNEKNVLCQKFEGHTGTINCLAYSSSDDSLMSAGGGLVKLWHPLSKQAERTLIVSKKSIEALAYSPSGEQFASAGDDFIIRIWERRTGRCTHNFRGHRLGVACLVYSPSGQQLASGGNGDIIRLWDTALHEQKKQAGYYRRIEQIVRLANRQQFLVTSGTTINLCDVGTGNYFCLWDYNCDVNCVAYTPVHHELAIVISEYNYSNQTYPILLEPLNDRPIGKPLKLQSYHREFIKCVAYSQDGQWLASGSHDNTIHLYTNINRRWEQVRILEGHTGTIYCMVYSPDNRLLASGSQSEISLWDVDTGKCQQNFRVEGGVACLVYAPDGQQLASGSKSNDNIQLWCCRGINAVQVISLSTLLENKKGNGVIALGYGNSNILFAITLGGTICAIQTQATIQTPAGTLLAQRFIGIPGDEVTAARFNLEHAILGFASGALLVASRQGAFTDTELLPNWQWEWIKPEELRLQAIQTDAATQLTAKQNALLHKHRMSQGKTEVENLLYLSRYAPATKLLLDVAENLVKLDQLTAAQETWARVLASDNTAVQWSAVQSLVKNRGWNFTYEQILYKQSQIIKRSLWSRYAIHWMLLNSSDQLITLPTEKPTSSAELLCISLWHFALALPLPAISIQEHAAHDDDWLRYLGNRLGVFKTEQKPVPHDLDEWNSRWIQASQPRARYSYQEVLVAITWCFTFSAHSSPSKEFACESDSQQRWISKMQNMFEYLQSPKYDFCSEAALLLTVFICSQWYLAYKGDSAMLPQARQVLLVIYQLTLNKPEKFKLIQSIDWEHNAQDFLKSQIHFYENCWGKTSYPVVLLKTFLLGKAINRTALNERLTRFRRRVIQVVRDEDRVSTVSSLLQMLQSDSERITDIIYFLYDCEVQSNISLLGISDKGSLLLEELLKFPNAHILVNILQIFENYWRKQTSRCINIQALFDNCFKNAVSFTNKLDFLEKQLFDFRAQASHLAFSNLSQLTQYSEDQWLQSLEDYGDALACWGLGEVAQNLNKNIVNGAKQGRKIAFSFLGLCFAWGIGTSQDIQEAEACYQKADDHPLTSVLLSHLHVVRSTYNLNNIVKQSCQIKQQELTWDFSMPWLGWLRQISAWPQHANYANANLLLGMLYEGHFIKAKEKAENIGLLKLPVSLSLARWHYRCAARAWPKNTYLQIALQRFQNQHGISRCYNEQYSAIYEMWSQLYLYRSKSWSYYVAISQQQLAYALQVQGDIQQAHFYYEQAIKAYEHMCGENSETVRYTYMARSHAPHHLTLLRDV